MLAAKKFSLLFFLHFVSVMLTQEIMLSNCYLIETKVFENFQFLALPTGSSTAPTRNAASTAVASATATATASTAPTKQTASSVIHFFVYSIKVCRLVL